VEGCRSRRDSPRSIFNHQLLAHGINEQMICFIYSHDGALLNIDNVLLDFYVQDEEYNYKPKTSFVSVEKYSQNVASYKKSKDFDIKHDYYQRIAVSEEKQWEQYNNFDKRWAWHSKKFH
jgi:hypothetical protein